MSTGCAVLTDSQVNEVAKFAKASQNYSELPGTLAESYGILLRNRYLLRITINASEADKAWNTIKKSYSYQEQYKDSGERMDAALLILKTYSNILSTLVSDEFTDELSKSAANLGESLDDAINEYKGKYKPKYDLKEVGGIIAAGIRAAGGIYIRNKQTEMLKVTLEDANPLVIGLMDEVKYIASTVITFSLIENEEDLGSSFKSSIRKNGTTDISTIIFVYDNYNKAKQTSILSQQISSAAETYKQAHIALVENTRTKKTLKEAIAQIKALSEEIKEANKVKKEVGK